MTTGGRDGSVLVIGSGIAGMAAGMQLAERGHRVYLLDTAPAIGGSMHLLDHTFPTDSCGLCLMLPEQPSLCPTLECERQERIELLPYAELVGLEGEPGAFRAKVRHKARYVDLARCTGCGACAAVCPEARPHDHEGWLKPEKAIYRPAGLRAVPDGWVIDMAYCTRCGACVEACPEGAVDLEMEPREEEIGVGAVLLTPGYGAFEARLKGEYGYGVYDNVVTALEFERMVSLAGSGVGHLKRPWDGRKPKRIAFVQCVGSRDKLCGAGYCSTVCCMYTAKQVALAKGLEPELEVTVYYMDLRAMGKGYEAYMAGVRALPGVEYRRAMPSSVHQVQGTRELLVSYVKEDGRLAEEAYDLLVLAVGLGPPAGMQELARELGVALNEYGFAEGDGYHPGRSSRDGVYVAGAFGEPKDIPDTVVEAAAAAAEVAAFLEAGARRDTRPMESESGVSKREVWEEEPRVGVFLCECDGDLSPVNVSEVAAWAQELPGVAVAQSVPDACSAEGRAALGAVIDEEGLNRVVVAGCTPRWYEAEFESMMRGVGLDPRLLARVNLREQVVYPHRGNGADVQAKACSLLGMAVAGLRAMAGLEALGIGESQALTQRALVVGGGAAGMTAAVGLAGLGIPVELVEREEELGGQWREIAYQAGGSDPQAALRELVARVEGEERIGVHLGAELASVEGKPGQYRSVVTRDGQEETVEHGVVVVATGGKPATTTEYLYGQHPGVLTQRELEHLLSTAETAENPKSTIGNPKSVVMVQCVGSRDEERPYCSRVCCTQAVKNALKLKELDPEVEVYVLYREVRTYGFRERYYEAARDAGVVFLRYEVESEGGTGKPRVDADRERLRVSLVEPVTGQGLELGADLLVLSVGVEADEGERLAGLLGVGLDGDGFFEEEHAKMKPVDLCRGGMYAAGLAQGPRSLEETVAQAGGVAMRAAGYLERGELEVRSTSVWVNERLCSFCGLCVEACPYEARVMDYDVRVAVVEYGLCQGCGVCAMVCPNKATLQKSLEHRQLMAAIDMAVA